MSCGNGECGCGCEDLATLKFPRDKKQEEEKYTAGDKADLTQEQSE